jgi:hypothetical protein
VLADSAPLELEREQGLPWLQELVREPVLLLVREQVPALTL